MTSNRPQWTKDAIWWSVYPLGACGAPIRTPDSPGIHHRLSRLENWLDYLVHLGCNGLALGPIWSSSTHGYDIIDHVAIDPRLGDDADFDHLVGAARVRGIRIMLDGVFNHVSSSHPRVEQARHDGPDSSAAGLFRKDPSRPDGLSRFEGHEGLVEIDHGSPEAFDYVTSVMAHWLGRGADGWRFDAAYRIPRPFLAHVIDSVRGQYPDMVTMGEILHGDYRVIAEESHLDSITQYELWKAIWSSLKDRNPHELVWTLGRNTAIGGEELPWTFVGNHDVTRIATQIGVKGARVAAGIVFTLPGMPSIYYGDEQGWLGLKEAKVGGDDAIRPELPVHPSALDKESAETFRLHQILIHIRRTHPWIWNSRVEIVEEERHHLYYRVVGDKGERLCVEIDVEDEEPWLRISDDSGELLVL